MDPHKAGMGNNVECIADKEWPQKLEPENKVLFTGALALNAEGCHQKWSLQFEDKRWASQYRRSQFPEGCVYVGQHRGGPSQHLQEHWVPLDFTL